MIYVDLLCGKYDEEKDEYEKGTFQFTVNIDIISVWFEHGDFYFDSSITSDLMANVEESLEDGFEIYDPEGDKGDVLAGDFDSFIAYLEEIAAEEVGDLVYNNDVKATHYNTTLH